MVGDRVEVLTAQEEQGAVIADICPRKNVLIRPSVANVDLLVIVLSAGKPAADLLLTDKLVLACQSAGITPVICINKIDSAPPQRAADLLAQYAAFDPLTVSAKEHQGLESLKERLHGKTSAFAGQSAVGKSSLLNAMEPSCHFQTGGLSKKTARGRHTTRQAELIYSEAIGGFVVDTPGFSVFEALELPKEELKNYYPEFLPFQAACRFASCVHDAEPDCAVRQAVAEGKIHPERYERYKKIFKFLEEKGEKRYD